MSDPRLDELAESARNRGLKLVRSRVRTPGKRRFGKVGLTDAKGKAGFGMDAKGPTARLEEVEEYLRNLGAQDWGASLDVAVLPRKRKTAPTPPPRPAPEPPKPQVREAKLSDAAALVPLIRELEHELSEEQIRKNLAALKKLGEMPLVATVGKEIVGLCGTSRRVVIHRPAPLGRITALAVAKEAQGKGIGRMLVEAAEAWMRKQGCQLIEVTSNDRRTEAHAFYRHLGYERTSIRFFKKL